MSSTSAEPKAAWGALRATALLFDMDGTLVDSHAAIAATWTRFAERLGLPAAAVHAALPGRPAADIVADFVADPAAAARELAAIRRDEAHEATPVRAVAGADELLRSLPGSRWAVVTSANRRLARARLTAAGLPVPDVLVTADDVERGKPDPQGFEVAAAALGVAVADCCVVEDSAAGFEAAARAGSRAIGIGAGGGAAVVTSWTDFTGVRAVADQYGVTVRWPVSSVQ